MKNYVEIFSGYVGTRLVDSVKRTLLLFLNKFRTRILDFITIFGSIDLENIEILYFHTDSFMTYLQITIIF